MQKMGSNLAMWLRSKANKSKVCHHKTVKRLDSELLSCENKTMHFQGEFEDKTEVNQQVFAKEKQKLQQVTEHTVRDVHMDCKAPITVNKIDKPRMQEKQDTS